MRQTKSAKLNTAAFLALPCRYFLAVAEAGSIRAAARRLNVAPSAISRQLALLEAQLGAAAFDRDGRKFSLSPAGEILFQGLRSSALVLDEAAASLDALGGLRRGLIRIATVESISVDIMPPLLQEFSARHPGVSIAVEVAASDVVAARVMEQSADIGFTFNPRSLEGLDIVFERAFKVCAVMAPAHPLSRAKRLTMAQCLAYPLALPAEGLSLRLLIDAALGGQKSPPAYECNSLRLMSLLARQGHCLSFQTTIGIEREIREGALRAVPLSDSLIAPDRLMIVRRKGRPARLAVDAFLQAADQLFRSRHKNSIVRKNRTR